MSSDQNPESFLSDVVCNIVCVGTAFKDLPERGGSDHLQGSGKLLVIISFFWGVGFFGCEERGHVSDCRIFGISALRSQELACCRTPCTGF